MQKYLALITFSLGTEVRTMARAILNVFMVYKSVKGSLTNLRLIE